MNTYEELKPILWKVAKKYRSNRHLAEDIVQAVCLMGGVFKVPMKLVYKRATWDTISYLRDEDGLRNKNSIFKGLADKKFRVRNPFSIWNDKSELRFEVSGLSVSGEQEHIDNKNLFNQLLKGLSRQEVLIIKLYYIESMTMKEVGRVIGVTEATISYNHKKVIEKVRRTNEVFEN